MFMKNYYALHFMLEEQSEEKREDRIMRNNMRVSSDFQCWYTV